MRTNVVESPIPIPLNAPVVTARVGHIPKRETNTGFSLSMPFVRVFILLIKNYPLIKLKGFKSTFYSIFQTF